MLTLVTTMVTPFSINQTVAFPKTQILAQTPSDLKAEADRLFNQGLEQYQTSKFGVALKFWQEAQDIASLLKTKAYTGNQATKVAIAQLMPFARIIHLATHGLIDDFNGSGVPGAVALAPSTGDNGLLTASEILKLKLNAELVVLSACNTARCA